MTTDAALTAARKGCPDCQGTGRLDGQAPGPAVRPCRRDAEHQRTATLIQAAVEEVTPPEPVEGVTKPETVVLKHRPGRGSEVSSAERHEIRMAYLTETGLSFSKLADRLGRDRGTI